MSIGVRYPDRYAVEETFQLLKVPWEWYEPGRQYDVVIARKADVREWTGNLIDLTSNDFFKKISDVLNTGQIAPARTIMRYPARHAPSGTKKIYRARGDPARAVGVFLHGGPHP